MANKHSTLTGLFTDIADAIRVKTGGTESIVADEFPEAISNIKTGTSIKGTTINRKVADGYSVSEGEFVKETSSITNRFGGLVDWNSLGYYLLPYSDTQFLSVKVCYSSGWLEFRKGSVLTDGSITIPDAYDMHTEGSYNYKKGFQNVFRVDDNTYYVFNNSGSSNYYLYLYRLNVGSTITMSYAPTSSMYIGGNDDTCRYVVEYLPKIERFVLSTYQNRQTHLLYGMLDKEQKIVQNTTKLASATSGNAGFMENVGICTDDENNFYYSIVSSGSSGLYISKFSCTSSAVTHVKTTKQVKLNNNNSAVSGFVNFRNGKFFVTCAYDSNTNLKGYYVDADTCTVISVIDFPAQGYLNKFVYNDLRDLKPQSKFVGSMNGNIYVYEVLADESGCSVITSPALTSTTPPSFAYAEDICNKTLLYTNYNETGQSNYNKLFISEYINGVLPTSGGDVLGVSLNGGSSGDSVKVITP